MIKLERIIAHRGASAYAPENTLSAFNKAYALGCRFIEFDVMLSADGGLFVIHDDDLNRTTNGKGLLSQTASHDILSLDAGAWFSSEFKGEQVMHFSEVLNWLTTHHVQANIELKALPDQIAQITTAALTQIHQNWPANKPLPLVSGFQHESLYMCRSIAPEIPLGLLLDKWEENWSKKAAELQCFSIHLNWRCLNASRVKAIKTAGYNVCAYTINKRSLAEKLLGWGVDALFSDYPDLLL